MRMVFTFLLFLFFTISFAQVVNEQMYYNIHSKASKSQPEGMIKLNRAIEKNPNDIKAYLNRGITGYYLNNMEGCCLDLCKAG